MSCYAVIDTNVLVSFLLKKNSIPSLVVELVGRYEIIPILHETIINEYERVLKKDKFNFDPKKIDKILKIISSRGIFQKLDNSELKFEDKEDKKFYDLYLCASKFTDVFLITGNKKHFPNENNIVNPREFFENNV